MADSAEPIQDDGAVDVLVKWKVDEDGGNDKLAWV